MGQTCSCLTSDSAGPVTPEPVRTAQNGHVKHPSPTPGVAEHGKTTHLLSITKDKDERGSQDQPQESDLLATAQDVPHRGSTTSELSAPDAFEVYGEHSGGGRLSQSPASAVEEGIDVEDIRKLNRPPSPALEQAGGVVSLTATYVQQQAAAAAIAPGVAAAAPHADARSRPTSAAKLGPGAAAAGAGAVVAGSAGAVNAPKPASVPEQPPHGQAAAAVPAVVPAAAPAVVPAAAQGSSEQEPLEHPSPSWQASEELHADVLTSQPSGDAEEQLLQQALPDPYLADKPAAGAEPGRADAAGEATDAADGSKAPAAAARGSVGRSGNSFSSKTPVPAVVRQAAAQQQLLAAATKGISPPKPPRPGQPAAKAAAAAAATKSEEGTVTPAKPAAASSRPASATPGAKQGTASRTPSAKLGARPLSGGSSSRALGTNYSLRPSSGQSAAATAAAAGNSPASAAATPRRPASATPPRPAAASPGARPASASGAAAATPPRPTSASTGSRHQPVSPAVAAATAKAAQRVAAARASGQGISSRSLNRSLNNSMGSTSPSRRISAASPRATSHGTLAAEPSGDVGAPPALAAGGGGGGGWGSNATAASPEGDAWGELVGSVKLQRGRWQLLRVCQPVPCAAAAGTVRRKAFDGAMELFQCNVMLQPGSLAAACLHDKYAPAGGAEAPAGVGSRRGSRADGAGEGPAAGEPHLWLFCPDPLCLQSRPQGSRLPACSSSLPGQWELPGCSALQLTSEETRELQEAGISTSQLAAA